MKQGIISIKVVIGFLDAFFFYVRWFCYIMAVFFVIFAFKTDPWLVIPTGGSVSLFLLASGLFLRKEHLELLME